MIALMLNSRCLHVFGNSQLLPGTSASATAPTAASVAQLLSTLLEYNPYNSTLDLKVNQERSKLAETELRAMSPAPDSPAGDGNVDDNVRQEEPAGSDGEGSDDENSGSVGDARDEDGADDAGEEGSDGDREEEGHETHGDEGREGSEESKEEEENEGGEFGQDETESDEVRSTACVRACVRA